MRTTRRFPLLVAGLLACGWSDPVVTAQTSPVPSALTVDAAIERAMMLNPTIAAARLRRVTSLAGVAVARERLNPEARVEIERETPKQAYALAVPLELGGKRSRRIALSEAAVRTSEAELTQIVAEVRAAIRAAYFDRLVAEARLALLNELQDLATRAREAAQQRFDAGGAPRLEVVQAELALAEAANQTTTAGASLVAARARLNALLALPLDASPSLSTTLDAGASPSAADAIARARTTNSEVAVADTRIAEQRARIALARALQVPDVTPEATLTRGSEPEFTTGWRAGVGVTIPIFTRHRAGVRLEEATLTQLTLEREALMARIDGDVTAAAALATAHRDQYERYRDAIVPQALEVERMAEDSYRLGRTGIAAFLQALQASRDARLRSLQSAADFQSALTDLERAIGTALP